MIVVDTNILAPIWLPSEKREVIRKILNTDDEWIAPGLWRSEFRSVLSLYYRRALLEFDTALQILREAEDWMGQREYEVDSAQVFAKISNSDCSAYDCEFVALADDLELPLLTYDRKILDAFPETAVTPESFLN